MKKKYAEINLFGQKWTVYKSDELESNVNGLCIYDDRALIIRSTLTGELFKRILLHELLHACFFRASFYVTGIPIEIEEMLVDQIAQMLVENSKFVANNLSKK